MKKFFGILLAAVLVACAVLFTGCGTEDAKKANNNANDVTEELGTLLYMLNFDSVADASPLDSGWTNTEGFGSYKDKTVSTDGRIWLISSEKSFVTEDSDHKGFIRFTLPFAKDEVFNYHPQTTEIALKKGTTYSFSFDARVSADVQPEIDGKNYFYFGKEYNIASISNVDAPNDNEWHTYSVNYTPQEDEVWGTANGDYLYFFQASYMSVGSGSFDIDNITIYETENANVDFEIDGKVVGTKKDVSTVGVSFDALVEDLELDGYGKVTSVTYNGKTYTGKEDEDKIVFTKKSDKVVATAVKKSSFAPKIKGVSIETDKGTNLVFDATMEKADESVKQVGWIIARKAFLDYANIDAFDFDLDSDVEMQLIYNRYGNKKKGIVSKNGIDTFTAELKNVDEANYGDIMVARPFVVDDSGTWYGKTVVTSVKETAQQMLDDGKAKQQKAALEEIVKDRFTYITLQKQKDKDFVVVNLTDMHLMAEEWQGNSDNCRHYKATVNELVERLNPDLITFSGDFCFAEGDLSPYEYQRDFIDSFGIPWTFTNGNHDIQYGDKFANEIVQAFSKADNFIYESKDKSFGVANYVVGIEQDGEIIHSVLLMDIYDRINVTVDENGAEVKNWNSFNPKQREWYEQTISELEKLGCKNSTLITHIPIKGFTKAYDAAFNKEYNPRSITLEETYSGDCWNEGYKDAYGIIRGHISDYGYEDDMLETINEYGNTKAVISGHDHVNNGVINYMGVDLAYSLKTGQSGMHDKKLNGGTCIIIDENGVGTVKHEYVYPEKW